MRNGKIIEKKSLIKMCNRVRDSNDGSNNILPESNFFFFGDVFNKDVDPFFYSFVNFKRKKNCSC